MQESRLFKIVYHLLNKGHATAPELSKKLEVSVRTIYRDIEALSEAGIPGLGNGVLQDILWDAGIDPRFEIQKANFLGGAVYYCENCQKKTNVPH